MKEALRKIGLGSALVSVLAGCIGERTSPAPNDSACFYGYATSREALSGARMVDSNCDGSVDVIRAISVGANTPYVLMISPSFEVNSKGRIHPFGAVLMTPKMQELADSIHSFQQQLYFLDDSIRYWSNKTGNTANLRESIYLKAKNRR